MQGRIIKYFTDKGFGFVSDFSEKKSYFFHISNFDTINGMPQVGEVV